MGRTEATICFATEVGVGVHNLDDIAVHLFTGGRRPAGRELPTAVGLVHRTHRDESLQVRGGQVPQATDSPDRHQLGGERDKGSEGGFGRSAHQSARGA